MKSARNFAMFPLCVTLLLLILTFAKNSSAQESISVKNAKKSMKLAATYFHKTISRHGGYIYHHSLDNRNRWGEGLATDSQIWVQPPGTPTVGLAFVNAYEATGDPFYLYAAKETAAALMYGQLKSGGWQNLIDFDPKSSRSANYLNGRGSGKNNSSFDDDQTTAAIRFLIRLDQSVKFKEKSIHRSVMFALDSVLAAQFANGGFPQVWQRPAEKQSIVKANYPTYDWRTEGRIKEYWTLYTLNDNVTGNVAKTLAMANDVYGKSDNDGRYLAALNRLGDFLILAQMPNPQPGWAQQYNYKMQPVWARRFEPPGVSGDETQETIETLFLIAKATKNEKYLEPIPAALKWLKQSELTNGQVARYYELKTNRPLYMNRKGKKYFLTYDDRNLPSHYGWKTKSRVARLEKAFKDLLKSDLQSGNSDRKPSTAAIKKVLNSLDEKYRWISIHKDEKLVGQPKLANGERYISSQVFADNVKLICDFLNSKKQAKFLQTR